MTNLGHITANGRCLLAPLTGVQRYTSTLTSLLGERIRVVSPSRAQFGHAWEQCRLPSLTQGQLLWSPANTGPIGVRRQVVTVHDIAPLDHPEWFSAAFAMTYRILWPLLLPRVRHIIADSDHTRSRLVERLGLNPERITTVHLGVEPRFATASPFIPVQLAGRLENRPFVLAVGSLDPRKNLVRLLAAWESARDSLGPDWRLVIAGGANPRVFAGSLPSAGGDRVVWAGRIADADLPGLYAAASIFVYPSLYEGFGLPPLEAMAAGVPVISSNSTSIPEAVGDAALLVDPSRTDDLADALATLARDASLRQQLAARGRVRAAQFTWERCAAQVWSILSAHA